MTRLRVLITPRASVLDPQGSTVERSLAALGHAGVSGVRIGKVVELTVDEADPALAVARGEALCEQILANPVIEAWHVEVAT